MTDFGHAAGAEANPGVCYRHPKRESWVLCQRCGRTICPDCQTAAAVGVQCPECVREGRASMPRRRPGRGIVRAMGRSSGRPIVTYSILGVTVLFYLLQFLVAGLTGALAYVPAYTGLQPWRVLTTALVHSTSSPLHLAFNMLALFVVGRALEPLIGRGRFVALYLLSALAGSLAVLLLGNPFGSVIGASGAVFGLFAAYIVIVRRLGGNVTSMIVIVGINLVIGFFIGGVSWQAHVGGLVGGALAALILLNTRRRDQRTLQFALLGGLAVALVVLLWVGYAIRIAPLF